MRERADWRHIKILMLTAKGREAEVSKGVALGADAYITKPFSSTELVAKVGELLAACCKDAARLQLHVALQQSVVSPA